jgi:hypothetical protein
VKVVVYGVPAMEHIMIKLEAITCAEIRDVEGTKMQAAQI